MQRAIDIGPVLLPWSRSGIEVRYGRQRDQIEQAMADLSCQLWRSAGVRVPSPAPRGQALLSAGHVLQGSGIGCALALLPLAVVLLVLAASNRPDAAIGTLLAVLASAVGSLLVFPGMAAIGRAKRLLLRTPLDLVARRTSARDPRGGRFLQGLGLAAGLGSLSVVAWAGLQLAVGDPAAPIRLPLQISAPKLLVVSAVMLVAGGALLAFGIVLYRRGQALLQPSADELMADDRRRPALLLRSFVDDDLSVVEQRTSGQMLALERLEESIAEQFRPFGPLVAIGKPGEALPELGASRNYYVPSEWHDAAQGLMTEALLIVLIAGTTPGLRWELDAIARAGLQSKLLILLPEPERQLRWDVIRQELQTVGAFSDLPPEAPDGVLCMHAGSGGGCTLLSARQSWKADYDAAIQYAIYGMFCAAPETTQEFRAIS